MEWVAKIYLMVQMTQVYSQTDEWTMEPLIKKTIVWENKPMARDLGRFNDSARYMLSLRCVCSNQVEMPRQQWDIQT